MQWATESRTRMANVFANIVGKSLGNHQAAQFPGLVSSLYCWSRIRSFLGCELDQKPPDSIRNQQSFPRNWNSAPKIRKLVSQCQNTVLFNLVCFEDKTQTFELCGWNCTADGLCVYLWTKKIKWCVHTESHNTFARPDAQLVPITLVHLHLNFTNNILFLRRFSDSLDSLSIKR